MQHDHDQPPHRRDVFLTAALGFVAAGGLLATWPFIAQLGPDADTPRPETTDVEIGATAPGQTLFVAWRDQIVIVRRRTMREIELSRAVPLAVLRDRMARNAALAPDASALDVNRSLKDRPEWLVMMGACPHDKCRLRPVEGATDADAVEAYFCPCSASRFDASGRVRSGPAPTNLAIPPFRFVTPSLIRIG